MPSEESLRLAMLITFLSTLILVRRAREIRENLGSAPFVGSWLIGFVSLNVIHGLFAAHYEAGMPAAGRGVGTRDWNAQYLHIHWLLYGWIPILLGYFVAKLAYGRRKALIQANEKAEPASANSASEKVE